MHNDPRQTSTARKAGRFSADERNAMRAFLQRSEVRLSTIHRVAVGFISGAGLLFLFPVFLKDGVLAVMRGIFDYVPPPATDLTGTLGIIATYLLVFYPFALSLAIPAAALILLLKDIVRFYFVGHPPSFPEEHFNPRFVLTGIAFSPDESEDVKARVLRYQYGTDLINFVISQSDAKSRYFSGLIDKPHRMIVPRTRKLPRLIRRDVLEVPSGKPLDALEDDDIVRVHGTVHVADEDEPVLAAPYVDRTLKEIDRFNAALGLAGLYDRELYQEVAKTEVSLVRHAILLRRLVLRYFQALLILIWTSLLTFMMLPFLQDERGRFPVLIVFSLAYAVWAAAAPYIVDMPLMWLASMSRDDVKKRGIRQFQESDGLHSFSRLTRWSCYLALAATILSLALELGLRLV